MVITMKKILSTFFLCLLLNLTANEIDTWSSPETISATGVNSSLPHVGMDNGSNAVAIWLENDALVSKTKLLGMSWSSADTLSAAIAYNAQLVVDPAGNATAIWVEDGGVIKANTKPFASPWGSPTILSASDSDVPQIAVDPSGNVVAVWLAIDVVQSSTQLFGMSWTSADTLSTSGSAAPQVALGSDGTVFATWHTLNGITSTYNTNAISKTLGGSWGTATLVSDPAKNSVYPQIAVDSSGNAVAIWYSYDLASFVYSNVILQSSRNPLMTSWSTPINISSPGVRNPIELVSKLLFNEFGNVVAVWTNSFNGDTFTIQSSGSADGSVWDIPTTINTSIYSYSINSVQNSIGDVFAVYMNLDFDTNDTVIKAIESHIGGINQGFWTNPVILSEGTSNAYPVIATSITGATGCYATAAWMNVNGSDNVIQASSGSGILVLPPSDVTVAPHENDMGVFVEFYDTLSWTASPDPNLVAYAIYRNGIFLTAIDGSATSYIYHNGAGTSYGISAVDNSSTESEIITVFPGG
jgi:hypothetical protein